MAIVETKIKARPNTNVEFFPNSESAEKTAMRTSIQPLKDTGKYTVVYSYPDTVGNLQLSEVSTFDSLETFGLVDTAKGIAFDNSFLTYYDTHELSVTSMQYSLTGIDNPFYLNTTYNFPTDNDPYIPTMTQSLEIAYDHLGKLVDLIVTSNSVSVIHQFNNATDFSESHFRDLLAYVPQLAEKNATRTITYTDGTYTK